MYLNLLPKLFKAFLFSLIILTIPEEYKKWQKKHEQEIRPFSTQGEGDGRERITITEDTKD